MPSSKSQQGDGGGPEVMLRGIGVSPGVVVGPACVVGADEDYATDGYIRTGMESGEVGRIERAFIETRVQIKGIQRDIVGRMGQSSAEILDAHLMVLDDRAFIEEIVAHITESRRDAESAVRAASSKYVEVLSKVEDDYLRERVADIKDVSRRIIRNLVGRPLAGLCELAREGIIVADDLAPSETAALPRDKVLGLITNHGSPTSHVAVIARAMEIPAIVGTRDVTARVTSGDRILIDGTKGRVLINPSPRSLEDYGEVIKERLSIESGFSGIRDEPAETRDGGARITLSANIESPQDVDAVLDHGAEGVGLFRSEFFYMSLQELPSEDELAESYESVAARLDPAPVIIRTLDIGGDKIAPYVDMASEANPFLGCRSIRFSLAVPEIFKVQLRAILRASTHGNAKLLYPMISSADEVLQANAILEESKKELRSEGVPFDENLPVGVMIETPSAALTTDLIAPHVSFFSLGTNDLIQYTIAVDRVDERLAYLYQPTHPAILRLIQRTVDIGHEHGLWIGVCGEMAGDPTLAPLLVGMGVDEVSVSPVSVPLVKSVIRSITSQDARGLAAKAICSTGAEQVVSLCRELISDSAPEILELTR